MNVAIMPTTPAAVVVVDEVRDGARVDRAVVGLVGLPTAVVRRLCDDGRVLRNGKKAKAGDRVNVGDELRVASTIFNNSTFTATNSGVAYTTANLATMNVALDVELAIDRLLGLGESRDNLRVVMSNQVWLRIKASTLFQNRLRGAGISNDTFLNSSEQAAADVFGVREVIIGRASYDTAPEGVAYSGAQVWSNAFIWVGSVSESGGGYFGGGAGFTLAWSEYGPVTGVFTYRDEAIKSNILRASHAVTERIVNANAGQLITTQYA
jgi:hypothetical protein